MVNGVRIVLQAPEGRTRRACCPKVGRGCPQPAASTCCSNGFKRRGEDTAPYHAHRAAGGAVADTSPPSCHRPKAATCGVRGLVTAFGRRPVAVEWEEALLECIAPGR